MDRVRFQLVRKMLPKFDFLIVDEAHKLKNPWTVQAQAVAHVLGGRFKRAVFSYRHAVPTRRADRTLSYLFGGSSDARPGFQNDVESLFQSIADYQRTYNDFEAAWRFADLRQAKAFEAWYRNAATTAPAEYRGKRYQAWSASTTRTWRHLHVTPGSCGV